MTRAIALFFLVGLCGTASAETRKVRSSFSKAPNRMAVQQRTRKARFFQRRYLEAPANEAPAPQRPRLLRRMFSGLSVEVAAGLNLGFGKSEPPSQGLTRNALAVSFMVERKLNDTFYLCPELAYVQRGVQAELKNIAGVIVMGQISLDYLELPLLLKAKLILSSPRWKLFFVAGPSVSIALNRSVEVLGLFDVGLSNRFQSYDANVVLGTGVEYTVDSDLAITGHLRHHIGLIDLDTNTDSSFYTRGIQLMVGAHFKL